MCHAVVFLGGPPATFYMAATALMTVIVVATAIVISRTGTLGLVAKTCDLVALETSHQGDCRRAGHTWNLIYRACAFLGGVAWIAVYLSSDGSSMAYVSLAAWMVMLLLAQDLLTADIVRPQKISPGLVIFMGLITAGIVGHVSRPDRDEAFYLAMSSSLSRFPNLPIFSFEPLHGDPSQPLSLIAYRVHSYELLAAFLSKCTGIWPIRFTHVLLPSIAGFLVPFALLRLARELAPRHALAVVALTIGVLVLDGSTSQGFGNFSFVRLFQGKAIFLTLALPLILAYALRYAQQPTIKRLTLLAAAQVAAIGLTATALPLAPMLAFIGVVAGSPALFSLATVRRCVGALTSSVYCLSASLYIYMKMSTAHASLFIEKAAAMIPSVLHHGGLVADSLTEVFTRVLGPAPMQGFYLGALLLAPALVSKTGARLATISGAVFFVFLGNPMLQALVERVVLGSSTYWRGLWIIPFPVLAALVWSRLGSLTLFFAPKAVGGAVGGVMVLCALVWLPALSTLDAKNRAGQPVEGLKVSAGFAVARKAASLLSPQGGLVLMQRDDGRWLPAMPRPAFPVFVKRGYLRGRSLAMRLRLHRCLERPFAGICRRAKLASALQQLDVSVVVLKANYPLHAGLSQALKTLGYRVSAHETEFAYWQH